MSMAVILVIDIIKYYWLLIVRIKKDFCLHVNIIIESINGNQQNYQFLLGQTQREAGNKNLLSKKLKYYWKLVDKNLKVFQQK